MTEEATARRVGVEALRALAHPLRVRIFSELSSFGPATASALAARLGESSGATSYHLRQLEKHGFVREDESRGNARDRWWERVPGPIELANTTLDPSPVVREAGDLVEMELVRLENERFAAYRAAADRFDEPWRRVAESSSANLLLTAEELDQLSIAVWAAIAPFRGRDEGDPARRRVDIQFRGFPVVEPPGPGRHAVIPATPPRSCPVHPRCATVLGRREQEGA